MRGRVEGIPTGQSLIPASQPTANAASGMIRSANEDRIQVSWAPDNLRIAWPVNGSSGGPLLKSCKIQEA